MTTSPDLQVEFRPLTIPGSLVDADAADFIEMTRVRNAVYREIAGNDDDALSPENILPAYRDTPDEIRKIWIVLADGQVIGRVGVDIPLEEGSRTAFWLIETLAAFHGRGIGSAAYALVEDTARVYGRTVLQSWAQHANVGSRELVPPTGFGAVPRDAAARFYLRHGYTLEQVERQSAFDLTADMESIERLLAKARDAAAGYRVVQWGAPTPPEYIDTYAWAKSRMSTDTPAGAMEFDEEVWDADRVTRHDRLYLDGGRTLLVTAAQHIASGRIVAFNELVIGQDPTEATHQEDTLVLKEHRGHRLGLLVKAAGILHWHREIAPDSPRIITYNAEENRPMLDINEALGFMPVAYSGAWKKVLDTSDE